MPISCKLWTCNIILLEYKLLHLLPYMNNVVIGIRVAALLPNIHDASTHPLGSEVAGTLKPRGRDIHAAKCWLIAAKKTGRIRKEDPNTVEWRAFEEKTALAQLHAPEANLK